MLTAHPRVPAPVPACQLTAVSKRPILIGSGWDNFPHVQPCLAGPWAGATVSQEPVANAVDRRMALAREWDELVAQVRELEGFEDFLRPPPLEKLLPAADKGPVAIINVSQWRCDALIVQADGVTARELPDLSLENAVQAANYYMITLQEVDAAAENYLGAQMAEEDDADAALRETEAALALEAAVEQVDEMLTNLQRYMWEAITEPVLDTLGFTRTPAGDASTWPRMWWCPTGPLTVLPLHSAGFHDDPDDTTRRAVIDRVVSSYTPTLRALLEARSPRSSAASTTQDADGGGRLLIVSLDDTPGQRPLNGTRERDALRAIPQERRTELEGPRATRQDVLTALSSHRWVHFSCHGDQDLHEPSRGGLQMYDEMLTIADISAAQFHGDYAGLAACKSAVGGVELLDEAITLAAALHYTGYRHVVATLWSVDDDASSEVFTAMYQRMIVDGEIRPDLAAVALHDVVRSLRGQDLAGPRAWTPFTHTGP